MERTKQLDSGYVYTYIVYEVDYEEHYPLNG